MKQKLGTPQDKYKQWLGEVVYDNKAGGKLLLNALVAAHLKRQDDGHIYITAISGDFDKVSQDREDIFSHLDDVNTSSKITINQIIPMHWDPQNIINRLPSLDKRYPYTDIYWCAGDQLALQVLQVLQMNDKPKKFSVGGFDWLPSALEKIKRKELSASVGGHFLMVAIGLVKIVDHKNGFNTFFTPPLLNKYELINEENVELHISFFEEKLWEKIDFNRYLTTKSGQSKLLTIKSLISETKKLHQMM